jgi:phosphoenolpyruvate carboxylase
LAQEIYARIQAEMEATLAAWRSLTGNRAPLEANPALARALRNRMPYLDPLNHLQVELLRRYRAGDSAERVRRGIHITINGIAVH